MATKENQVNAQCLVAKFKYLLSLFLLDLGALCHFYEPELSHLKVEIPG